MGNGDNKREVWVWALAALILLLPVAIVVSRFFPYLFQGGFSWYGVAVLFLVGALVLVWLTAPPLNRSARETQSKGRTLWSLVGAAALGLLIALMVGVLVLDLFFGL